MKLSELAIKVSTSINHSKDELEKVASSFKKDGEFVQKIESEKFEIWKLENALGFFQIKDNLFLGFIQFSLIDDALISLDKIFICEEFRNKNFGKLILFWAKQALKKDIFIGGPIFKDGQAFLKSLITDKRFKTYSYNIRSNKKTELNFNSFYDGDHKSGIILEHEIFHKMKNTCYNDISLPGQKAFSKTICISFFDELGDENEI